MYAKTKILLADDHPLVADSLAMMLETEGSFEIIGIVHNGWQAYNFIEEQEVDVLLTDFQMPLLNGKELVLKLKEKDIPTRSIILTMSEDADDIKECIQLGVHGYVMKSAERDELIKAIKQVAAGNKYFSEKIVLKLAEIPDLESPNGKSRVEDVQTLTKRELEVLQYIVQDLSNLQIADQMGISPTTVETHRRNLMKKVGVSTAIGLMRWGLKNGVLKEEDII